MLICIIYVEKMSSKVAKFLCKIVDSIISMKFMKFESCDALNTLY